MTSGESSSAQPEVPRDLNIQFGESAIIIKEFGEIIQEATRTRRKLQWLGNKDFRNDSIESTSISIEPFLPKSDKTALQWSAEIVLARSEDTDRKPNYDNYYTYKKICDSLKQQPDGDIWSREISHRTTKNPHVAALLRVDGFKFAAMIGYKGWNRVMGQPVPSGTVLLTSGLYVPASTTEGRVLWPKFSIAPPNLENVDQRIATDAFFKAFLFTVRSCSGWSGVSGHKDGGVLKLPGLGFPLSSKPYEFHPPEKRIPKSAQENTKITHIDIPEADKAKSDPPPKSASEDVKDTHIDTSKADKAKSDPLISKTPVSKNNVYSSPPPKVEVVAPDYELADIGGLSEAKEKIQDIIAWFLYPDIMKKWDVEPPKGVLLYGESGTGKTMLAHALANEIDGELWLVGSNIYGGNLGDAMKTMKDIFSSLKNRARRTVVFFDEADGTLGKIAGPDAGGGATAERNSVAAVFRTEMDALKNPNVLIVAATNDLDKLDEAVIRSGRFNYKLYLPRPNDAGRREIIGARISKGFSILSEQVYLEDITQPEGGNETNQRFASELDIGELATQTDGMTGADLATIFNQLAARKARLEIDGVILPITHDDILRAIDRFKRRS